MRRKKKKQSQLHSENVRESRKKSVREIKIIQRNNVEKVRVEERKTERQGKRQKKNWRASSWRLEKKRQRAEIDKKS